MRYRMGKIVKKKFKKEDFEYLVNNTGRQGSLNARENYFHRSQCFHFRVLKNPFLCLIFANISLKYFLVKTAKFPGKFPVTNTSIFRFFISFYTYYVFVYYTISTYNICK